MNREEFARQFREGVAQDRLVADEDAFETERVRFLLTRFNLTKWEPRLRQRHSHYSGQPLLRFSTFHDVFPSFPMTLAASRLDGTRLHLDAGCLLGGLFRNFRQSKFVKAYEDLYQERGGEDGKTLALCFPYQSLRQGLVIYLADKPKYHVGLALSYAVQPGKPMLIVQAYQKLIEAIHANGHGWKPEPFPDA